MLIYRISLTKRHRRRPITLMKLRPRPLRLHLPTASATTLPPILLSTPCRSSSSTLPRSLSAHSLLSPQLLLVLLFNLRLRRLPNYVLAAAPLHELIDVVALRLAGLAGHAALLVAHAEDEEEADEVVKCQAEQRNRKSNGIEQEGHWVEADSEEEF